MIIYGYYLCSEIVAERSNISGSGLIDIRKGEYSLEVLQQTELAHIRNKLCPIVESADFCGKVSQDAAVATGLLQGTPVYGRFF